MRLNSTTSSDSICDFLLLFVKVFFFNSNEEHLQHIVNEGVNFPKNNITEDIIYKT